MGSATGSQDPPAVGLWDRAIYGTYVNSNLTSSMNIPNQLVGILHSSSGTVDRIPFK